MAKIIIISAVHIYKLGINSPSTLHFLNIMRYHNINKYFVLFVENKDLNILKTSKN